MRKVEPQPLLRDQRTFLGNVIAEPAAQGGMEQVRGRVIGADRIAPGLVDFEVDGVAHPNRPGLDAGEMRVHPS